MPDIKTKKLQLFGEFPSNPDKVSTPDWNAAEGEPGHILNKPNENDALELVLEMGLVEPALAMDGSIYTDENGVFYTL